MHAFLKGVKPPSEKPSVSGTNKKDKKKKETLRPWVDKYRPRCVDDVAYQDEVTAVLKKAMQNNDLPNLLFYGPPGTGKTSTILAASKELFGDMYRERVLELNASDERGINVVREKVKRFSQLTASGTRPDGKPCPPFKIVILDEADSMTSAAQAALRRTMEKETKTTRFCLICNYVSRIIEPLTSRCAKFRFKPLSERILKDRLKDIASKENINYKDEAIDALLYVSEGDMRKAITYLQSCARFKQQDTLTKQDVYEIAGVIPDQFVEDLVKVCHSDSYEKVENHIKDMMLEGHAAGQLINQLHDKLLPRDDISDKQKSVIFERLAIVDKKLMDGADEYLQIMDLCTVIMNQLCHSEK